jgi:uncharacterized membrane protein
VSKEVSRREAKKPLTVRHGAAVVGVGVVAALVAFWVLSSIVGIIFFIVKLAVVVGLVGGVIWLVHRFRR